MKQNKLGTLIERALVLGLVGSLSYNIATGSLEQARSMNNLGKVVRDAPRIEYVVREGDTMENLRNRYFPLRKGEYSSSKNSREDDYWQYIASTMWTNTVARENKVDWKADFGRGQVLYLLEAGDTIKVPVRH